MLHGIKKNTLKEKRDEGGYSRIKWVCIIKIHEVYFLRRQYNIVTRLGQLK